MADGAAGPRRHRARHDRTPRRLRVRAPVVTASAPRSRPPPTRLRPRSSRRSSCATTPTSPFAVRMGLHTGEAIERDRNYFGSEVNRAARLMSLAHGGQVLVSDTTEVLLRNRVALRALGEHRLRGLRGRMSVYQVVADGLPAEFPVLRSVDCFVGQPPAAAELARRPRGAGRRGRRARAVEPAGHAERRRRRRQDPAGARGRRRAGRRVPRRRVDGRAGRRSATRRSVPAAIATVLGITPQGDAPLIDTVADALAGRRLLLVVDNCEHVLAARGIGHRGDPRPVRERQGPRHVTRDPRRRRRDGA